MKFDAWFQRQGEVVRKSRDLLTKSDLSFTHADVAKDGFATDARHGLDQRGAMGTESGEGTSENLTYQPSSGLQREVRPQGDRKAGADGQGAQKPIAPARFEADADQDEWASQETMTYQVATTGKSCFGMLKCAICPHAAATEKRLISKAGDGVFTDCMDRIVPKAKPDDPEAFCAWYHQEQTGRWPGEDPRKKNKAKCPDYPHVHDHNGEPIALPTKLPRRKSMAENVRDVARSLLWTTKNGDDKGAMPPEQHAAVKAAMEKGWQGAGGSKNTMTMTHPSLPGHTLHVKDDGKWAHIGPGSTGMNAMHNSGEDAGSLSKHLGNLHRGFEKRAVSKSLDPWVA